MTVEEFKIKYGISAESITKALSKASVGDVKNALNQKLKLDPVVFQELWDAYDTLPGKPVESGEAIVEKEIAKAAEEFKPPVIAAQTPAADQGQKLIPFKITHAKKTQRYLKALIYGDFGTGKTTLASTAVDVPAMCDVLFIDAESGNLSIADKDVDVIGVRKFSQFARVHEFLRLHCKAREDNNISELIRLETIFRGEEVTKPRKWKTVVIDSLTEVQKYCMYQLLGITIGEQKLDLETTNPEFKEWGQSAEMIRLLVRSFRDLPMNVIFVCPEKKEQDDAKRYHYSPSLPGKLGNEVQGFLDVVGYLAIKTSEAEGTKTIRRLFIQPGKVYQAKNRLASDNVMYIEDPTLAKLVALSDTKEETK